MDSKSFGDTGAFLFPWFLFLRLSKKKRVVARGIVIWYTLLLRVHLLKLNLYQTNSIHSISYIIITWGYSLL